MQTNVLQIVFSNETDKKQSASLFQLFSDNSFIKAESSYSNCRNGSFFSNLKSWLLKNKFDCELIRLQFKTNPSDVSYNHIYFRKFIYRSGNPFGASAEVPLFIIGEAYSPKQFQSGIVDIPVDCEFDGYTTDVMFDVYPKETIVVTLFEKITEEKKKRYAEHMKKFGGFEMSNENKLKDIDKGLTPFKGFPVVVENTSDEEMVIDLFNPDHYRKLVEYDKNGLVYSVYDGRESFGLKNCVMGNSDEKEYNYIATIQSIKSESSFRYYDCVRIVNPNEHQLNDIMVNGREVKANGYVGVGSDNNEEPVSINDEENINTSSETFVSKIAVDVILDQQENFDSFIVKVPAKTNMMFSFGKRLEIEGAKPQRLVSYYSM